MAVDRWRVCRDLLALFFRLLLILVTAAAARTLGVERDSGERREYGNAQNFKEGIHAKKRNRDFPVVNSLTNTPYYYCLRLA